MDKEYIDKVVKRVVKEYGPTLRMLGRCDKGDLNMEKDVKKFGHPIFYELLEQMAELHSRKNHDYAGISDPLKNLRAPQRIGISPFTGVLVRLQDKWSRLEEFVNSGTFLVKDESVEDTLMDNAVYSLLAIILRREEVQKEKSNE